MSSLRNLFLFLPMLGLLAGCEDGTGGWPQSESRFSLSTRTAVRCRNGGALLFLEPRLEVTQAPQGARARFYLGDSLLEETVAGGEGNLSFSASIPAYFVPRIGLTLDRGRGPVALAYQPGLSA